VLLQHLAVGNTVSGAISASGTIPPSALQAPEANRR
jgi:hypothetical protein